MGNASLVLAAKYEGFTPGRQGQIGHNQVPQGKQLKQETVTVQPIKGHFIKAKCARDIEEDMHSGAYLHQKLPINQHPMKLSCDRFSWRASMCSE